MHLILKNEKENKEDIKMKDKSILTLIQTTSFTLPPQYTIHKYAKLQYSPSPTTQKMPMVL